MLILCLQSDAMTDPRLQAIGQVAAAYGCNPLYGVPSTLVTVLCYDCAVNVRRLCGDCAVTVP